MIFPHPAVGHKTSISRYNVKSISGTGLNKNRYHTVKCKMGISYGKHIYPNVTYRTMYPSLKKGWLFHKKHKGSLSVLSTVRTYT